MTWKVIKFMLQNITTGIEGCARLKERGRGHRPREDKSSKYCHSVADG